MRALGVVILVVSFGSLLPACSTTTSQRPPEPSSESALKVSIDELAGGVTTKVAAAKKPSVAIVGFTPVMSKPRPDDPFSRYLVEELTTKLVNDGRVTVAERAQLDKVMTELKLQSSGAVNDASAKQLGQLLGVDAVLVGTYTDLDDTVRVNQKTISTESGEVLAATSTNIPKTKTVARLLGQPHRGANDMPAGQPIYKKWWFWTIVGAVVVGGTVGTVAATTGGDDRVAEGPDGRFNPTTYGTK